MTTETLKNPTAVQLPEGDAVGIDVALLQIQIGLSYIPWLEKIFGRAWTLPTETLGKKASEPKVYQGSKEYYPVLPNDALKAYSFFRVNSPRVLSDYGNNLNIGGAYRFEDNVDLFVWADLEKIDVSNNYIFKEALIRDVLKRINIEPTVQVIRVFDDKADDIYRGYTINEQQRELLMYPYTAFRIEMTLKYQFACS